MLLPLDVLVAVKLAVCDEEPTYADLAHSLDISASQAHAAVQRCRKSGIVHHDELRPMMRALGEYLIHGVKYAYPAELGSETRGIPTAHSMTPLKSEIISGGSEAVWPHPEGTLRGTGVTPLYKVVPTAVANDHRLHEILALLDAIRIGRVRERKIAEKLINDTLRQQDARSES